MSGSTEFNLAAKLSYVAESLQLDPAFDSERIISARNLAFGLFPAEDWPVDLISDQTRRDRRAMNDTLRDLRLNFWELSLELINEKLMPLASGNYPDVQIVVTRLRSLATERDKLLRLARGAKLDANTLQWLKSILVLPRRDVTKCKQNVEQYFRRPLKRRRLRQFLDLLKQEVPAVYALEAEWFQSLRHLRMSISPFAYVPSRPRSQSSTTKIPFWLIWIALIMLSNALRQWIQSR